MNEETKAPEVVEEIVEEAKVEVVDEAPAKPGEELLDNSLKVKADPPDIAPEDRKRNVKKLAGAIAHSLRANGEVNVRCFGNAAIGKGAKALAIAKDYIGVDKLQLSFSPAFITTKIGENELTGICFCTFASKYEGEEGEEGAEQDFSKCESVLMVKADPREVAPEDRRTNVKKLAGAIAHSLEENREVAIRCFGNATIGKASKALAIARGFTATRGPDLYCSNAFIVADMAGQERTGICFYAYTNEI